MILVNGSYLARRDERAAVPNAKDVAFSTCAAPVISLEEEGRSPAGTTHQVWLGLLMPSSPLEKCDHPSAVAASGRGSYAREKRTGQPGIANQKQF